MDPRVARSRAKIFDAVCSMMAEEGYSALTIEGVAARAGVGKTTIYRHWESMARLVHEAVGDRKIELPDADTGSLRDDLMAILRHLVANLTGGLSANLVAPMIIAAEIDPEMEVLHRAFIQQRREPLLRILRRAVERGELNAEVDVEVAADMLSGPLFFRRFITRAPITMEFAEQLVDTLLPQLVANRSRDR